MTLSTLLPPKLVAPPSCNTSKKEQVNALECSVHTLPKPLLREFHHVFGNQYLIDGAEEQKELLAIPTNQRARQDLVAVGDHIEEEKDRLLNVVSDFDFISGGFTLEEISLVPFFKLRLLDSLLYSQETFVKRSEPWDTGQTLSILVQDFP